MTFHLNFKIPLYLPNQMAGQLSFEVTVKQAKVKQCSTQAQPILNWFKVDFGFKLN